MAKISSMTGYGLPPNQRLILPVCLTFWLLFLILYWSPSIIPFKPAESLEIELHAINASTETPEQSASSQEFPEYQNGQNDTVSKVEDQQATLDEPDREEEPPEVTHPRDLAANSTLGFEEILALSVGPSWRTRGLDAAAELTGLSITVPPQPKNPDELVDAFRQMGAGTGAILPAKGSAKAWMAHLDLLRFVIASGPETALIIEDDVDWDVEIKSQMRLVSDNVREYMHAAPDDPTPFGTEWDVLWLGHCGALAMNLDGSAMEVDPLLYPDETRITNNRYTSWSKKYNGNRIPDGYRQVQDSIITVCSFAYGVTKKSAPKVLDLMARGMGEAFDVQLSTHCEDPSVLKCLVVNPQLFNHYEPPKSEGYVSIVDIDDDMGGEVMADESSFEDKKGFTESIGTSARCRALFNSTCNAVRS